MSGLTYSSGKNKHALTFGTESPKNLAIELCLHLFDEKR